MNANVHALPRSLRRSRMGRDDCWDCFGMRVGTSPKAATAFGLLVALTLAGCAGGENDGSGYPKLSSVPSEPRPSLPVEERREIVRDLIKERDESRRQTTVVRRRSGLSTSAFETPDADEPKAETIIPDEPAEAETFTLRGEGGSEEDAGQPYRGGAQFEDGSLDDFIRQLERDTSPEIPDEPGATIGPEDETSFFNLDIVQPSPVMLAAFAPAPISGRDFAHGIDNGNLKIRLAAAEDERSTFCRWLGWAVGMLGACLPDSEGSASESEGQASDSNVQPESAADVDAGSAVEDEARGLGQEENAENGEGSTTGGQTSSRREEAERRLSEEDASEAIEDLGRGVLAPVRSSLDKLRDFMRARRSADPSASPDERRAYRGSNGVYAGANEGLSDYPPTPLAKPKVRFDLDIEDDGETFAVRRMQPPAFKPAAAAIRDDDQTKERSASTSSKDRSGTSGGASEAAQGTGGAKTGNSAIGSKETKEHPKSKTKDGKPSNPASAASTDKKEAVSEQEKSGESAAERSGSKAESPVAEKETGPISEETEVAARTPDDVDVQDVPETSQSEAATVGAPPPRTLLFEPNEDFISRQKIQFLKELVNYSRENGQKLRVIGEARTLEEAEKRIILVRAALQRLEAEGDVHIYDFNEVPGVDQVRFELVAPVKDSATETKPLQD